MADDKKKENQFLFKYWDFVSVDGKLWYSSCIFNGLFCQSMTSKKVEFVDFFPGEELNQWDLYRRVILIGRELVFIPFNAIHINIYNLDNKSFKTYEVPDGKVMNKYVSVVPIGDRIYMFPILAKKAICFDLKKRTVEELKEFNCQLETVLDTTKPKFFWLGTVQAGDWIYLLLQNSNQLIGYNWKSKKLLHRKLIDDGETLRGMAIWEDQLYIRINDQNKILCWNTGTESIAIKETDSLMSRKGQPMIAVYEKKIYLYFNEACLLYVISRDSMNIEKTLHIEDKFPVFLMKQMGKDLFFLSDHGGILYRYDMVKEQFQQVLSDWKEAAGDRLWKSLEFEEIVFYENDILCLKDYIGKILRPEQLILEKSKISNRDVKIWNAVKNDQML